LTAPLPLESLPSFATAIAPEDFIPDRLSVDECKALVIRNQVRFRGWYFPHIQPEQIVAGPSSGYVEETTDTPGFNMRHYEKWRMTRSGQFLFRGLLWEATNENLQQRGREEFNWTLRGRPLTQEPPGFVSFILVIYAITEAYVFASRLAQSVPYTTPVEIRVGYYNIDGWALTSTQPEYDLHDIYICERSPISVRHVPVDQLVGEALNCAAEAVISIFQQFGWMDPTRSMIEQHQRNIVK
jgi:hypothetical protein